MYCITSARINIFDHFWLPSLVPDLFTDLVSVSIPFLFRFFSSDLSSPLLLFYSFRILTLTHSMISTYIKLKKWKFMNSHWNTWTIHIGSDFESQNFNDYALGYCLIKSSNINYFNFFL